MTFGAMFFGIMSMGPVADTLYLLDIKSLVGNKREIALMYSNCKDKVREARPFLLTLSAPDPAALTTLARSYLQLLSRLDDTGLPDVCNSANCNGTHHEYRIAALAETVADMSAALDAFIKAGRSESVVAGRASGQGQRGPVFVFNGMGAQWFGMGRELLRSETVFRQSAHAIDELFRSVAGWSLLAEVLAENENVRFKQTEVAQPANFLLQVALTELLRSWGVAPAAVIGHSAGELAAAFVSGALDLESAVRVTYHRSRLQQRASGRGRMLAVELGTWEARALIGDRAGQVSISAINSLTSATLAGEPETLAEIREELNRRGISNRDLQVEVAYHSPHMEPLKDELRQVLRDLRPSPTRIPVFSTVTGQRVDGLAFDAEYWCDNIRRPVLFAAALDDALACSHSVFLEVGPHPVLNPPIKQALRRNGASGAVFSSLRRKKPELTTMVQAAAGLHVSGCEVNLQALSDGDRDPDETGAGECYFGQQAHPFFLHDEVVL
jgi:acyl transferase domain-containing protein